MDTLAAIALASEPKDPEVMVDKPRKMGASIVTGKMIRKILAAGIGTATAAIIFMFLDHSTPGTALHSVFLSTFFTAFVMMQLWNLLNAKLLGTRGYFWNKLFSNRNFIIVFMLILLLQVVIVEAFPGDLFRTTSLLDINNLDYPHYLWPKIIIFTSFVFLIGEVWRMLEKKKRSL